MKSNTDTNLESLQSSPVTYGTRRHLNNFSLRDRLILDHAPMVRAIASHVRASMPVHMDLDDLIHAGVLGLIDAASRFDPGKVVGFAAYAKHRIRGSILDHLRSNDWASRGIRARHKKVAAINTEFAETLQRTPTEEEIADKVGVDVGQWRQMAVELRICRVISATSEQEQKTVAEAPAAPSTHPDKLVERKQLSTALEGAIRTLPDRYQTVVSLYYRNEMTMKEIGSTLNINESRVSQIHKAALQKMGATLRATGVSSSNALI